MGCSKFISVFQGIIMKYYINLTSIGYYKPDKVVWVLKCLLTIFVEQCHMDISKTSVFLCQEFACFNFFLITILYLHKYRNEINHEI